MKTLRQLHLYLGCIFAPLIIYFSISGAWQVFRFNDVPKDQPSSAVRAFFHELSKPHTNSTLPGLNPKTDHSIVFNGIAVLMSAGMIITASIGLLLAFKYTRSPRTVWFCVIGGIVLPIVLLFIRF